MSPAATPPHARLSPAPPEAQAALPSGLHGHAPFPHRAHPQAPRQARCGPASLNVLSPSRFPYLHDRLPLRAPLPAGLALPPPMAAQRLVANRIHYRLGRPVDYSCKISRTSLIIRSSRRPR
jgi:hypothetical protein